MIPKLYAHPFSSYCQKVFMAFYEKALDFELRLVAPEQPGNVEEHPALWPLGRFPILSVDGGTFVEATVAVHAAVIASDRV